MDLIDKKIICALDSNCRTPFSVIAHNLKIGRNVVAYRIKKLEEKGIIKSYISSINLGKLDYKTYKIYFKLHCTKEKKEKELENYLIKNNAVIHCLKLEGTYNYSVAVAVKNTRELDALMMDIKSNFKDFIKDYLINITVYTHIFKIDKILLNSNQPLPKIIKYDSEIKKHEFDDKDKIILRLLSKKANISIVDLAKKAKLSLDVVKYRLKSLNKKVITSNRAIFDFNKLDFYHYVFLLKIRQASIEDENRLVSWCTLKKNVLYCAKRIGYYDFEINVAIKDIAGLNVFVTELKKEFGDIIDSYEILINCDLIKLNYVPF